MTDIFVSENGDVCWFELVVNQNSLRVVRNGVILATVQQTYSFEFDCFFIGENERFYKFLISQTPHKRVYWLDKSSGKLHREKYREQNGERPYYRDIRNLPVFQRYSRLWKASYLVDSTGSAIQPFYHPPTIGLISNSVGEFGWLNQNKAYIKTQTGCVILVYKSPFPIRSFAFNRYHEWIASEYGEKSILVTLHRKGTR